MRKFILLLLFCAAIPSFAQEALDVLMTQANEKYFTGRSEEAYLEYKEISKAHKNKDAYLNAAFIAMELGKPREAVDVMNAARKFFPKDNLIIEFLADAYLADGQFLMAEKLYSLLLDSKDKKDLFYINLGKSQLNMDEEDLALLNFTIASKGKALTAYSNYMLGVYYEGKNQPKQAAEFFKKAVDYDAQFLEARVRYAKNLEDISDVNEAWKQYRMVYMTEKNNENVKKAMDALQPQLTKSEKELLQPKELHAHTKVKPVVSTVGVLPVIRVGIGAKSDGSPAEREELAFTPSHNFKIYETKTKKLLASGAAKQTWNARIIAGKPYIVTSENKKILFSESITIKQTGTKTQAPTLILKSVLSGAGMTWASIDDKEYRGEMEVAFNKQRKTLIPINVVNVEEYVFGVLASEMPVAFPTEALKAQAILARTYVLQKKGRHKKWGYDVCDTQHCQVYGGVVMETPTGNAAVEGTMGIVLTYKGKPIEAVFSSNCGGFTQSSKNAGWYAQDYLVPRSDYKNFDFDNLQPYHFKTLLQHPQDAYGNYSKNVSPAAFRWVRVVSEEDIREIIKKQRKDIGRITAIIPSFRAKSGYLSSVKVVGENGSVELNSDSSIKRNLSLGMLRSSYFIVQPVYVKNEIKEFVFFGGGWGHGVGFCQTGSAGRAEAGQKYPQIITHYYPGTKLEDIRLKK